MRKICKLATLALVWSSAASADADLREIVKEHRLGNGMKWLIVERPEAPVFTGFIRVRAGGADEEPGYTGLAHLFEHMAFKGTPVLGTSDFEAEKKLLAEIGKVGDQLALLERAKRGQSDEAQKLRARLSQLQQAEEKLADQDALSKLYELNGAQGLNATTDKDLTSYFVSFPKNRLELWSLVEASRLAAPVLRDFYKERDVVMEERRLRVDSDPGGLLYEELNQVAFTTSPYRWPVVGYAEDMGPGRDAQFYSVDEVGHFSPMADPKARWRGMSWLTPILTDVYSDQRMTEYKTWHLDNGAMPGLVVKYSVKLSNKTIETLRKRLKAR